MTRAELDLAIQAAWPPREIVAIGPWTARLDAGVTRRPNSVLPHGAGPEPSDEELDALLADAAALYRVRGLVPWIQVTDGAWPRRLEERLAARGWQTGIDRTLLLTGPLPARPAAGVVLEPRPSQQWLDTWWAVDPRGGTSELAPCVALLRRIDAGAFARVVEGCHTLGVALGVIVGDTLVLECVATVHGARRRGVATRAVSALGAWGAERGATQALLAVQERNAGALRLYRTLGLARAGAYAYACPG